jgi:sugar/nucleoside kinase (ribokinase family)
MITDRLLASARHLHIGSYYLLEGIHDALPDLLCRAKAMGLTVSLDTNWDPKEEWRLPEELLKYVDVFMPNENEIILCSGKQNFNDACSYFAELVPVVAVKQGGKGGTVLYDHRTVSLPPEQVAVVDTVGAGDSFDGGFLFGYLNGWPIEKCLRAALYCGSMNTACAGGIDGQAHLKEMENYFKRIEA